MSDVVDARSDASATLFEAARHVIPGGVNSPVRAFRSVGGTPRFIAEASGAWLTDEDGNRYVDYVLSWGPMILGHANPAIVAAISHQAAKGTSYGAPTALETTLAEMVIAMVPSVEMVRFVSSGTEATMSAVRLARAFTGRTKVLKFAGCYHGHADAFLVQAGSGVATLGLPDSPGVTPGTVADTLTCAYNDLAAATAIAEAHTDSLAAIIVEPVVGNMGLVQPLPGYLEGLRALATRTGAVLIFDEVMTGFRVAAGGAQAHYGITPDLTCLGKVIGGGLPVAAYGGRRDIMAAVAPSGKMYQAGTLSGNPIAMAAGIATLRQLQAPDFYATLTASAERVVEIVRTAAAKHGVAVTASNVGSMWGFFLCEGPVADYESAKRADTQKYATLFHTLLMHGVYVAPSQFEAAFISSLHGERELSVTAAAFDAAFAAIS
ncbi:glutamate-1-semialdehyde-2,1-aminomutase [bacterium]|nr:glutamate-1-semialdehyde-2,1-aminomutase [bacterium]